MNISMHGYDKEGNYIHVLSGNKRLVELSMRSEYSYTDQPYPDDGEKYIFNGNKWVLQQ